MKRILVIDDDAAYRRVCTVLLQRAGYDVVGASDGTEGLRKLSDTTAHAVITDILMPGKEGIETIMALRREHPSVKVLAMSGGGTVAAEECLAISAQLGVVATLRKPFSGDDLLRVVQQAIGPGESGAPDQRAERAPSTASR